MEKFLLHAPEGGRISIFHNGTLFRRESKNRWLKGTEPVRESWARLYEWICRHPEAVDPVRRYARLPQVEASSPIDCFSDIPLTTDLHIHKTQWLVDRLFPEGELILITGLPGSFKSFLAGYLGAAVSEGREFLGRKTKRTRVLILDRDNPAHIIAERREMLKMSEGSHLRIWHYWGGDPPPVIGDLRLEELAREHHLLIIFDSFVRFHSADENTAKDMAVIMGELRKLVIAGATVIVLHHSPKGDPRKNKYRGSSDIHAAVDVAFNVSVDRKTNPPTITFECFKQRAIEEFTMKIRPDFEHGRFEVVADSTVRESDKIVETLKALILEEPGLCQEDLIERSDLPEHKARKALTSGENVHWKVKRPSAKTKSYYPI
jgi:hypothetical protein